MDGFVAVYDQCSQEVKDKLKAADDWEATQQKQSLHKLINKIERICVGFDDHKQEVAKGCSVICHGLVRASHLNGELGEVRAYHKNITGFRLGVHFEKMNLKPELVKSENLRIAFELPSVE